MAQKINPMNPVLIQAWTKGREAGRKEASTIFADFLNDRVACLQEIPGIGEKTAWKVQEHFLKALDEQEPEKV